MPYGAVSLSTVAETKGWIGERFDADAGLQYRCARYYDPQLGMFLQPD
ncbi:MAG: RHS repeat-associated core domain-containing protein [Microgenomates group bacterium]